MNYQYILEISERLKTQDNRITQNPMFCVQEKRRAAGFLPDYSDNYCWHNPHLCESIYDDDKDFKEPEGEGWFRSGYKDRWTTVMVSFTEKGCEEYLRQNGHNLREPRIYVESFNRCPEMIAIREWLLEQTKDVEVSAKDSLNTSKSLGATSDKGEKDL